jgi:hypothetical protein
MAKHFKGKLGMVAKAVRGALVGSALLAGAAQAGEGSFGWIYTLDLQPKGTLEFEQRVGLVRQQAGGKYDMWQTRTELEYGVSNDFQIAGYFDTYSVNAAGNSADGTTGGLLVPASAGENGSTNSYRKTRTGYAVEGIWRLVNPVLSPVGVGLYAEYIDGQVKRELEGRVLLQSNFLDDKLVVASNLVVGSKEMKFDDANRAAESEIDLLLGATYRFANRWTAGMEYRYHNDFNGYRFATHTQEGHFIGPNVHYATKDWWITAAWRHQLSGGKCMAPNEGECSKGYVWDGHGRNEYIVKVGFPF